jgi:3'(2'), 5'-bisphosphate nucleotidase
MIFSAGYEYLLIEAMIAAKKAGEAVLDIYKTDFSVDHKDDRSPLTLADKRSHTIIFEQLSSLERRFPVLSEEGKDIPYATRKGWESFWLVDPLDGTKEFIKRNGEFTVNIALIRGRAPVLGVIYVPVHDVMYLAAEGIGAYRLKAAGLTREKQFSSLAYRQKAEKLPLPRAEGRLYTIVASRSHMSSETEERVRQARVEYGDIELVSAGSSLKFCTVAEGFADEYPRLGPTMEWDTAAGQAIVQEAGGLVVDFTTGIDLAYNKESLKNNWFTVRRPNKDASTVARH